MIALLLDALLRGARDLWKVVKLLAGMAVIAAKQVAGFVGALLFMAAKSVVAQALLLAAAFALLRTGLGMVLALGGLVVDFTGLSAAVHRVLSSREGIMYLAWNICDIPGLYAVALNLVSLWFAGFTVAKYVEYTFVVTRYGVLRGFWR